MIGNIDLDKLETQEFLSIEEVSTMFDLSKRTISTLIVDNELRTIKWGKYKRIPVTSVLYYLVRKGILFSSQFNQKLRLNIYESEKSMFDAKKTLTISMEEIIKKRAMELIQNSEEFNSYREKEGFIDLFK